MRSAPEGWMDAEREFESRMKARSKLGSRKQKWTLGDVVLFSGCAGSFLYFIL